MNDGGTEVPLWRGRILGQGRMEVDPPAPVGAGLVYPLAVPEGTGTATWGHVPGPWGPIASYMTCVPRLDARPPSLTIGLDWPFPPLGVSRLEKGMAEALQLQLFVQDWWEGRGSPPFQIVSAVRDVPGHG